MTAKQQEILQRLYDEAKNSEKFTQEELDRYFIGFPVPPIVK